MSYDSDVTLPFFAISLLVLAIPLVAGLILCLFSFECRLLDVERGIRALGDACLDLELQYAGGGRLMTHRGCGGELIHAPLPHRAVYEYDLGYEYPVGQITLTARVCLKCGAEVTGAGDVISPAESTC